MNAVTVITDIDLNDLVITVMITGPDRKKMMTEIVVININNSNIWPSRRHSARQDLHVVMLIYANPN